MSFCASAPPEERERLGATDGQVRVAVGIGDADGLIADRDQTLAKN